MVQSLNISVACAVTLYEVVRQRIAADMYPRTDVPDFHQEIADHYTVTNKTRERMIIKDMPDTVDRMGE
jgi:tRNA C32,U32 (ribose-2'-O)-methylase TrmJ